MDGALVDGPVYTSIYDHLIGIRLTHEDAYKEFQSSLAVYHDDYGDYSTNEPTMDGTASLIYLLAAQQAQATAPLTVSHGAIVKGDSSRKAVALVFTGDEFGDGLPAIAKALAKHHVTGSFFFTGRFYRNPAFQPAIKQLYREHHYLGPHSDQHLLYNDWTRRDSTLVTVDSFRRDLQHNLAAIHALGIDTNGLRYFIPPYEWWNDTVAAWAHSAGWQLINFTPGIRTNADYTWPEMGASYLGSDAILQSLKNVQSSSVPGPQKAQSASPSSPKMAQSTSPSGSKKVQSTPRSSPQKALSPHPSGLNGAIILIHAGTDPRRKDKLYNRLDELIDWLQSNGYQCLSIPKLLYR
ncbi:MAG TPA: polysaccharide deacetylase family protein [Puia sp.]